jgi:predicted TIM-barrel fold metal-dependent hydrolase
MGLWEAMLPYVIDRIGEGLSFMQDYPHEPDLAEAIRKFEDRKDLTDSAKSKILSDNGKRFYKMEA